MKIPGRSYRKLGWIDIVGWNKALLGERFTSDHPAFDHPYDSTHTGLAFFVIAENGQLAINGSAYADNTFDALSAPSKFLMRPDVVQLVGQTVTQHQELFGSGYASKIGLYCFKPGGVCGYHTDGPVYLDGQRQPVDNRDIWKQIAWANCTHRTIVALQANDQDEFLICGQRKPIAPGLWIEFDNTLPHAFYNKGDKPTILLVTTFALQSEIYKDIEW